MNISNIGGMGINPYTYTNRSKKTVNAGDFASEVQKGESSRKEEDSSIWKGDMVIQQPPSYLGFTYDRSISNKPKEAMTMDEYKQWFMNEMSGMPVSGWYRSTCVGGALTITEECFERMKKDPEWENTVLGMVRKMYSTNSIMGAKMIGYQVIGATPEQCYGEGIPVKDDSPFSVDNKKSWWEERYDRMKEQTESKNKTDIIVKPDGSRVLVVTMNVGGMEATMSLEISKPTNMLNESREVGNRDFEQDMGNYVFFDGMENGVGEI